MESSRTSEFEVPGSRPVPDTQTLSHIPSLNLHHSHMGWVTLPGPGWGHRGLEGSGSWATHHTRGSIGDEMGAGSPKFPSSGTSPSVQGPSAPLTWERETTAPPHMKCQPTGAGLREGEWKSVQTERLLQPEPVT